MNLSDQERQKKLDKLIDATQYGDLNGLLISEYGLARVTGICTKPDCDFLSEVFTNTQDGYCINCGSLSVVSGIELAGVP